MTIPACTSFAGMATTRFLLGTFKAVVNPGFVFVMGNWYTLSEQALRLEAYYCTNGIATMVGGLTGYAIGNVNTVTLPRQMYVFLIFRSLSVCPSIITLLFLRELRSTAKILHQTRAPYHRERRLHEQLKHKKQTLIVVSSVAGRPRSENLDPLHHGDQCTSPQQRPDTVHQLGRRLLQL